MSLFLLLYIIIALLLLNIWIIVYRKYWKYVYWKYFLFFCLSYFLWLLLYISSFTFVYEKDSLLILSRFMYWLSLTWLYSMLMFIIFFNSKEKKLISKYHLPIVILFTFFFFLTSFTTFIIKDMLYSIENNIYYEDLWIWYFLYTFLSFILPFLIIIISYLKVKTINSINKIRFLYIIFWFIFLVVNEVVFLALLPIFNIWILQKEQILFFLPFIFLTWYSISRYHFADIKYWIWRIIIFLFSLWISIALVNLINIFYNNNYVKFNWFWWYLWNDILFTELIICIISFLISYKFFNKIFLWNAHISSFEKQLWKLKSEIPYISNLPDLKSFLMLRFNQLFKIKYTDIILLDEKNNYNELIKFFKRDNNKGIFINDYIFIEENKNKYDKKLIIKEINSESYLIFPLYNNSHNLQWFINLWQKPFNDSFNIEEIYIIKDFIEYISWHLKYIKIYDKINDLNINLDKKIDEKTMQYNALINKQKDFISLISHEIKWPIWSSVFQVDCLLDDIEDWKYDKKYLETELWLLNVQLLKIGDLTNKLFSIEKYDIWKIELLKEKININDLIASELEILIKKHPNINFVLNLDENVWFLSIDKVQFIQVIDNLVYNAVKFTIKSNITPEIHINTYLRDKNIFIEIEDNWKEFEYTDISSLFEKYTTWKWSSIWLWMWLYLCKKIISLHNWEISAVNSEELWWARFIICLPK